jgi:fatty acid desaturase
MAAREARKPEWVFMYWDLVEDMPIVNLLILVGHQLIAWPIYLAINNFALPRMRAVVWWKRSHFYYGSDGPNFKPSNRDDVILSDFGIGLVAAALWASVNYFGVEKVFLFYGAPWLWTNHWICKFQVSSPRLPADANMVHTVTITFLQHTDSSLAYYPSKTWSFLRGAASTVDRDFGFIGRNLFHGAIEYHVLHHHASRIPCYHAEEASNAIKGVMGSHYQSDVKTPLLWAFWRNYNSCRFVEEKDVGSGVYFFGKK